MDEKIRFAARIMFCFLFVLLAVPLVSSESYRQNECVNIKVNSNSSLVNLSYIAYPNSSIFSIDMKMSKIGTNLFNFSFCETSSFGEYSYIPYDDSGNIYEKGVFSINYNGQEITSAQSILYGFLFLIFFFFMFGLYFMIQKLPSSNSMDEEGKILSINYLKYFRSALWFVEWMLFVAVMYLSSNVAFAYLGEKMFGQILFTLFRITFSLTPIIVILWIVWIFVKMFHDKQFQQILNRGMFPQGRL